METVRAEPVAALHAPVLQQALLVVRLGVPASVAWCDEHAMSIRVPFRGALWAAPETARPNTTNRTLTANPINFMGA